MQLERWEYVYNYIRPHQFLDYLTPNQYYNLDVINKKESVTNVLDEYSSLIR